jgi:hypothetical protein
MHDAHMKALLAIALLLVASAAAANVSFLDSAQPATPAHPSMYSFADVYRLTVSGERLVGLASAAPDAPVRVAAAQSAPAAELQFSVVRLPEPRGWLLLLAGLALALWVARRRLGYSFR